MQTCSAITWNLRAWQCCPHLGQRQAGGDQLVAQVIKREPKLKSAARAPQATAGWRRPACCAGRTGAARRPRCRQPCWAAHRAWRPPGSAAASPGAASRLQCAPCFLACNKTPPLPAAMSCEETCRNVMHAFYLCMTGKFSASRLNSVGLQKRDVAQQDGLLCPCSFVFIPPMNQALFDDDYYCGIPCRVYHDAHCTQDPI